MVTPKNNIPDKYADYRYEIVTPEELREANWLIEQGLFNDMEDYIELTTRAEIRIMKRLDAEKKKRATARKKRCGKKGISKPAPNDMRHNTKI